MKCAVTALYPLGNITSALSELRILLLLSKDQIFSSKCPPLEE